MAEVDLSTLTKRLAEVESRYLESQKNLSRSISHLRRLEERVRLIEATPSFRLMRALGGIWNKLSPWSYLQRPDNNHYAAWLAESTRMGLTIEDQRSAASRWQFQPRVSVILPVNNSKREWLQETIDSVRAQSYGNWEICLCEEGPGEAWVSEFLESLVQGDSRIQYTRLSERSGPSAVLNRAGALARGEYLAFLDGCVTLAPNALYAVFETLQTEAAGLVYADEDHIGPGGIRTRPKFRPAWSPELLLSCMYLGHFLVVSRATIEQAGWFRGQCDGAECYDLALRISEASPKVHHVPQVLCHWRSDWTGSAADLSSTNHSIEAGRRSLEEAVKRKGWCARVIPGPIPATYSVQRKIESYPTLTVVICSRNGKLLERCLKSLKSTTVYPEWDVVVVWHMVSQDEPRLPAGLAAKVVPFAGQFNYSRMNNLGAAAAKGELLLFLNDDVEPILEDWMSCLAAQLIRENVGIVGACLLYPSGLIQHAGVVPGMLDGAGHPGRGLRPTGTDLWPWLLLPRNVSAVTGACMGVRKAVFERLGGMDTAFPNNYNDVDLCLRAAREGFLTIYEARAVLRHHECATRPPGTNFDERELFHSRWSEILESGDPYYSPSLRNDTELPAFRPLAAMQPRRP